MEGSRISKRTTPTRVPGAATVGSGQYRKVTGACQQVPARREIGAMFVTPQYHGGALCRTWVQDSEHHLSVLDNRSRTRVPASAPRRRVSRRQNAVELVSQTKFVVFF